jgi:hypothetical protein
MLAQYIPGCAGGCRSLLVRHGSPVLGRHNLPAVRSHQEELHRSLVHSVHRTQLVRRILGVVAARLRVGVGRSHVAVVEHRRRTVQVEAKSSCYGLVVRRVGLAGLLAGRTMVVQYQCMFRSRPGKSCGCIRSHSTACCAAFY